MLSVLLNSAAVCSNLFSICLHSFPIIVLRVSTWTTRSFADNSAAICLHTYMPRKTFQLAISPLQFIGSGGGYYVVCFHVSILKLYILTPFCMLKHNLECSAYNICTIIHITSSTRLSG